MRASLQRVGEVMRNPALVHSLAWSSGAAEVLSSGACLVYLLQRLEREVSACVIADGTYSPRNDALRRRSGAHLPP